MTLKWLLLLFLSLILVILFVNPVGDFPLNDDWHYGYPVKTLIETGKYELTYGFAPNIFLQVLWGYLFCGISGEFSFTYLRYSTIATSILGGILFFQMLRRYTVLNIKEAIFISLLLIFNPIYFSLSFTFMTDVPFLVICLLSIYFYLGYLETKKNTYRLLGATFSIAALFIRQPGILLFVGAEFCFLLFYFLENKNNKGPVGQLFFHRSIQFLGILLVSFITFSFIEDFLKPWLRVDQHYLSVEGRYVSFLLEEPLSFFYQTLKRIVVTIFYLGFFCLPLVSIVYERIRTYKLDQVWLVFLILVPNVLFAGIKFSRGYTFPYEGNIFYNLGLGPVLTKDTYYLQLDTGFEISNVIMLILGLVCQLLGSYITIFFIKKLIEAIKHPLKHKFILFVFFVNMLYLGAMIVFSYFDRYLLFLFVSILFFFCREPLFKKVYQYPVVVILSIGVMFFSIVATKDYLAWNRANKEAFNYLKKEKVDIKFVYAGLPINGFEQTHPVKERPNLYITSFNQLEGYEQIKSFAFYRWLFGEKDYIYILKKI